MAQAGQQTLEGSSWGRSEHRSACSWAGEQATLPAEWLRSLLHLGRDPGPIHPGQRPARALRGSWSFLQRKAKKSSTGGWARLGVPPEFQGVEAFEYTSPKHSRYTRGGGCAAAPTGALPASVAAVSRTGASF
jgi:hypothetical protein